MNKVDIILLIVLVAIYILFRKKKVNKPEEFDEDFKSCESIYGANNPRCKKNNHNMFDTMIEGKKLYIHPLTQKDVEETVSDYKLVGYLTNQFINTIHKFKIYEMMKDNAYAKYKLETETGGIYNITDRMKLNDGDVIHFWKNEGFYGPFVFKKSIV